MNQQRIKILTFSVTLTMVLSFLWITESKAAPHSKPTVQQEQPTPAVFSPPAVSQKIAIELSVKDAPFGAKGDGVTDDTHAINNAILFAEKTGGIVHVPTGRYRITSAIVIGNNITLNMTPQTVIVRDFSVNVPIRAEFKFTGATIRQRSDDPAKPNHDITIRGGFVINKDASCTGSSIALSYVKRVRLESISIKTIKPGDWGVTIDGDDVIINGLNIDHGRGLYEDGLHIFSGNNITITNCIIKSGDDAIALAYPRDYGSIKNVTISNCAVYSQRAMGIKLAQWGDTTSIENVTISNIVGLGGFERNGMIEINSIRRDSLGIRNIHLSNIHIATGTHSTVNPYGIHIGYSTGVTVTNVTVENSRKFSLYVNNSRNVTISNSTLSSPQMKAPCVYIRDTNGININNCLIRNPNDNHMIHLLRVRDVQINNNRMEGV